MKYIQVIVPACVVLICATVVPTQAQTIVVTQPSITLSDTQSANVVIRERRNGPKVEGAQIDFCFQNSPNGPLDRAVFELTPKDGMLAGAGITARAKVPVEFSYASKYVNDRLTYTGIVKIGAKPMPFEASYISENTEKEYRESLYAVPLVEKPANFTTVSPQWLAVRTRIGTMPALIDFLRRQNVIVDALFGLVEDCDAMRNGSQTIQFIIHPDRAEAVIAAARKLPGVVAAGWGGSSQMAYAVRLPAAQWVERGKPDRRKLEAMLEKSIGRAVGAKFVSAAWDATTGDLLLKFTRPSQYFPGLGFSESIEVVVLAELERPGTADHIVVWVNNVKAVLNDGPAGARVRFRALQEMGGEGLFVDPEPIALALARDFKGVTWNATDDRWN